MESQPILSDQMIVPFGIAELTEKRIESMRKECKEMKIGPAGEGYLKVKKTHIKVKKLKSEVTARHKGLKEEHLKACQELDRKKRYILGLIEPILEDLAAKRKVEDDRLLYIKQEGERKEQARIDGIRLKIFDIKTWCYEGLEYQKPACEIVPVIGRLTTALQSTTAEIYQEFLGEVQSLLEDTITKTQEALHKRLAWEKEYKEQEAERVRLAAIREKQEAEAERQRLEREEIAKQLRALTATKEQADEEKRREEFEKQVKLDAEKQIRDALEAQERAEKDARKRAEEEVLKAKKQARIEAEQEILAAEKKKIAEEAEHKRQEALKPDKEKLLSFAHFLEAMKWPDVTPASIEIVRIAKQTIREAADVIRESVNKM
jgi:hypothetical protein